LLLKEGKVVACGNYEEITKTGFNVKDILNDFLSANEDKTGNKNASPTKAVEKQKSESSPTKQKEIAKEVSPDLELKKEKSTVKLTTDEIDHGPVTFKDYRAFFAHSGGIPGMLLFLVVAICASLV
jgi:predicted MPP superfamily phosphohydrolase